MIHNLLRLLQWYTAVHHLMNPTPNNWDNLVNKMLTAMEGVTYTYELLLCILSTPDPPPTSCKLCINLIVIQNFIEILWTDTENAKKRPAFCWQPHTARLLTIYNRMVIDIVNWRMALLIDHYNYTVNPRISTQALTSNLGKDGGHLFERGAYSRGRLVNFSQIVAWHDHFFYTSSAHKQQLKPFIDIKSWS